jgi:hypothetical protein
MTKFEPKFLGMKKEDIYRREYWYDSINWYDDRNNHVYYENDHNYYWILKYDKNNNIILYTDSDWEIEKWEYDDKNEIKYYATNVERKSDSGNKMTTILSKKIYDKLIVKIKDWKPVNEFEEKLDFSNLNKKWK